MCGLQMAHPIFNIDKPTQTPTRHPAHSRRVSLRSKQREHHFPSISIVCGKGRVNCAHLRVLPGAYGRCHEWGFRCTISIHKVPIATAPPDDCLHGIRKDTCGCDFPLGHCRCISVDGDPRGRGTHSALPIPCSPACVPHQMRWIGTPVSGGGGVHPLRGHRGSASCTSPFVMIFAGFLPFSF